MVTSILHRARSPQLARLQGQYLPGDLSGLLFCLPMRHRAEAIWESGKHKIVAPTTQTVDASGYYIHPITGRLLKAQANKLRIGGVIGISSRRKGAIFEAERRNICLQTEDLGTAWGMNNVTNSINTNTAPDGALSADSLEDSTEGFTGHAFLPISITNDSAPYIFSAFIKKTGGYRYPGIQIFFSGGTGVIGAVTLDTQTEARAHTNSAAASGVDDFGDYWRLWLQVNNNGSGNVSCSVYLFPALGTSGGAYEVVATGTNVFWGAQLEKNVSFPSSYIKTLASATTRAKEIVHYSNADEANCKAAAGTIYFATTPQWSGTEGGQHWVFSLKAANDGVQFFHHQDDGNSRFNVSSGGVAVASLDDGFTLTRGQTYIWAMMWAAGNFRLYRDGVLVASDSSGDAPTAMATTIDLGHNPSDANHLDGQLAHFHIYDSDHSTARALRNYREIKAWMGV